MRKLLSALFLGLFIVSPAFAATTSPSPAVTVKAAARCSYTEKAEEKRLASAQKMIEARTKYYDTVGVKVKQKIADAKASGKDVTKAQAALVAWETNVAMVKKNADAYLAAVKLTQSTPCATNRDAFKSNLAAQVTARKTLNTSIMTTRTQYQKELRKELRKELAVLKATGVPSSTTFSTL